MQHILQRNLMSEEYTSLFVTMQSQNLQDLVWA